MTIGRGVAIVQPRRRVAYVGICVQSAAVLQTLITSLYRDVWSPLLHPLRSWAICLIGLGLSAGCGRPALVRPVDQWVVQGGRPLSTLLPVAGDTAVVLVYNPSQCFSCDGELSKWLAVSRRREWQLHLLLTREPTSGERDQLRLFRLEPRGILQGAAARLSTPRVYQFAGPVLVDSAVGSPAEHGLLDAAMGQ